MTRIPSVLFISLFLTTHAVADEKAVQKYRNYTPQQIKNLSEKVLNSELPMMYNFAARKGLSDGSEVLFAAELNRLMYSGVHDNKAAIKAFQTDLGDTPTGVLTVWQIHKLEQRSGMQGLSQVLFPDSYTDYKSESAASIQGTMTIIDEKIAWPINHVKLTCYKHENYCQLDQLNLTIPNDTSWSQNYGVLKSNPEYYTISRWDQNSIDAFPAETATGCRTTSLNLNFKTKEFYQITRNAGGDCEAMGIKLDKLPKPRIAQIVDGSKIIREEFAKVEKAAFEVLASDVPFLPNMRFPGEPWSLIRVLSRR